ncbi:hypothetical protein EHQ68_08520 [Leptospira congkakensis]|uniref:Uncharacterized protein n=1 Tax=Leptospira congkakensis TaxID=2484932 RepID=A0A4Z1AE68_9LEPT|nr:hypothetical protein [Leptospira congkakensis]TGL88673.1 hypothetical protein EHQ69_14590 [Leptospira congkakensis]TGL89259.1 hypothetical protein EHQ68_08520 [Leptospira congkakensis]TGL97227.1 hypothetical protein EHQ70_08015 [Leptospira congkakensis]
MRIPFSILYLFFLLSLIGTKIEAQVLCLGGECSNIPSEYQLLGNFAEPVFDRIYTNGFLRSMGDNAVLQNLNSNQSGGSNVNRYRLGLGYTASRGQEKARDFYYENSELRTLPKAGVAASPSLSFTANLGEWLDGSFAKQWNLTTHFFPYEFGAANIPFVKIRNTDVNGRVFNYGAVLRYFPIDSGFSFGMGIFQTNQDIYLSAYDRRPTQFRIDGDKRRWIGQNDLFYQSRITSASLDLKYNYTVGFLSIIPGVGLVYNHGYTAIQVTRFAAISTMENPDDFTSVPSAIGIKLTARHNHRSGFGYGSLGFKIGQGDINLALEFMAGKEIQSVNLSLQKQF